jgi:hypothetical protein
LKVLVATVEEVVDLTKTATTTGLATDKNEKVGGDRHNYYNSIEIMVIFNGQVNR